jgi:hypothetical protein
LYASETTTISWWIKTSVDKIGFVNFAFRSGSTDAFEFLPQIRNGTVQIWAYSKKGGVREDFYVDDTTKDYRDNQRHNFVVTFE